MQVLLEGIVIIVLSAAVLYCLKARFHIRPLITLKYVPGKQYGSPVGRDKLKYEWNGTIELHNPTPHDAYDVSFLLQSQSSLPTPTINPAVVPSMTTPTVPFNVVKVFDEAVIFPHENDPPRPDFTPPVVVPLRDFFPEELKTFRLVVQYTNGHGLNFYTCLNKTEDSQSWSTHRMKPRT